MPDFLKKRIVSLGEKDGLRRIDELVAAGARVALVDAALAPDVLSRLKRDVLAVFAERNQPVGLMLRLTPGAEPADPAGFQYVLLSGWTPGEAERRIRDTAEDPVWLVDSPEDPAQWLPFIGGVLTGDGETAEKAALAGKLVVCREESPVPGDGVLLEGGITPERLQAAGDTEGYDEALLLQALERAGEDPGRVTGCFAVRYAMSAGADAIIVLTADGKNIAPISSLRPPVPIIAVGRRPAGEGMLLRQILRHGVLPTAISKTPRDPGDRLLFARFVAGLYGYGSGKRVVVTGHWLPEENQDWAEILVL